MQKVTVSICVRLLFLRSNTTRFSRNECSALVVVFALLGLTLGGCQDSAVGSAGFLYTVNVPVSVGGYRISGTTGALGKLSGFPFRRQDTTPGFLELHPSGDFLYVLVSDPKRIIAYHIARDTGALTQVPGSPFSATGMFRIRAHPGGKFLLGVDFDHDQVAVLPINTASGGVGPAGSSVPTGDRPMDAAFTSTGTLLFVSNGSDATISVFRFDNNTGGLSPVLPPVGVSGRDAPLAVAGEFLYAASFETDSGISAFHIDSATGTLTPVSGSPFPSEGNPRRITASPDGKFLYLSNSEQETVSGFRIDSATGALTPIPGSPFASDEATPPADLAVDPSSSFLYVHNVSGNISAYRIDAAIGALTPVPGSPFPGEEDTTGVIAIVTRRSPFE
jgi:6-phosphogluconolactonase (cycloisomerase 2 family)